MCVCVCVCVNNFRCRFKERKKYFEMKRSTKNLYHFKYLFIHFVLTFVYVSSLLLSSENIRGARPCEWGTQ